MCFKNPLDCFCLLCSFEFCSQRFTRPSQFQITFKSAKHSFWIFVVRVCSCDDGQLNLLSIIFTFGTHCRNWINQTTWISLPGFPHRALFIGRKYKNAMKIPFRVKDPFDFFQLFYDIQMCSYLVYQWIFVCSVHCIRKMPPKIYVFKVEERSILFQRF